MKLGKRLRQHRIPLGIWTLVCGLFFASFLLGKEHFSGGDLTGQFYGFGLFQAREIAQGRLPIWSPGSFGGIPFAADTQSAVFYPPRWLSILFSLPWQFPYYALELEAIIHVWLTGLFTYALGYVLTQERWAGLTAAVAFGLGGFLASYPLSQLAILETVTWLPLVLLLLRIASEREKPLRWLIGAGLALAVSALAGHPQTFLHVSYVAAAYYLFMSIRVGWRWTWAMGAGGIVVLVAIGTATIAWLPARRFAATTVRSSVDYAYVSSGAPLLEYVHSLVPNSLSMLSPTYIGVAASILALAAWLGRDRQGRSLEITFWGAVALLTAWLALGDAGVLFELAYRLLPGFSLFRQQERLLGMFSFSTAMLAAQGMAVWLSSDDRFRRALIRRVGYVWLSGLLVTGLILTVASSTATDSWPGIWWRQVGITVVVLVLLWQGKRSRGLAPALIMLLAVDLYLPSLIAIERQTGSPAKYWPEQAWVALLGNSEPSRFDSGNIAFANLGEIFGVEDIRGISPLKPRALAEFETLPPERRWQLLNVTHVIAPAPPDDLSATEIATMSQDHKLYRLDNALPRVWMSYQPTKVTDAAAALARVRDPAFDPASEVVLHTQVPGIEQVSAPEGPSQVEVTRLKPNALKVTVATETSGLLVISEWAYPGWRATVDGHPVPLHPADYALQTLWLPAGSHQVELRFVPFDIASGAAVSLATLVAIGVLVWRWHPQEKCRPIPKKRAKQRPEKKSIVPIKVPLWIITLILFCAFILRMYTAATQELRADEAFSYLTANQAIGDIVPNLIELAEPQPPLHNLILHIWLQLAGRSELALRYLSITLGLLLLPLAYQVGRQLKDRALGLLMILLLSTAQVLVWASQDVRSSYAWTPLFEMIATLLLLAATNGQGRRRRWIMWVLYALTSALTVYSHTYGVFALLGHGCYLLFSPRRRRYLWEWAGSGLVAALLFVPWPLLLLPKWLGAGGHLSNPGAPPLTQHLLGLGRELAVGSAYDRPSGRWLFLGGVALALLGIDHLKQYHGSGRAAFLAGWLGSAMLFMYLVRFFRATFNDFYILLAAPAWWALIGLGLLALWRSRTWWKRLIGGLAGTAIVVSSLLSLSNYYFNPLHNRTIGYRPIASQIRDAWSPNDVFVSNAPDPSLSYYLEDIPVPRTIWPSQASEPTAETEAGLISLTKQYDRIWFVPDSGSLWDKESVVERWFNEHSLLEWDVAYEKLSLKAYRPLRTATLVMKPTTNVLRDEMGIPLLQLEGVFLAVNGIPAALTTPSISVQAEEALQVTLLWKALAEIPTDYTVFVHLLDARGTPLLAQHDGVPFFGLRHTSTWKPGERVLDRHELAIPATPEWETAVLLVGLYDSGTLERQTFEDGRDAILIADFKLE